MSDPVVSVCVANYQGEELLKDCLDSVLAQARDVPLEIIVHDDASTDGSLALLANHYPQVRVLASATNVGFCVANNRMADAAGGRYLLLLNNDAALAPGALAALVAAAGEGTVLTLPQFDWLDGHIVDRGALLDPFLNPVPNLDPARRDVAMVIGACLFVPTALWRELGGFPPWMESLGEDLYFCGRVRLRGMSVRAVVGPGYRHRQGYSFGGNRAGSEGLHSTYRRRALSERNKTFALLILTPGAVLLPLAIVHLAALLVEGVVLCAARRSLEPWRRIYGPALALPVRERARWRAERRTEQRARTVGLRAWFASTRWWPRKLAMLVRYGLPGLR